MHSAASVPFEPSVRAVRAGREVSRLQFARGIRWCSTRWRLGVYHGARRGEVAGAVHIDSRDEGRVEDRNDFGLISSTAEPVLEACLCWELKACERKRGRGAKKAVL